MEAIGLGIDIVELARIRQALERHRERFLARVYTAAERRHAGHLRDPVTYLAGRFAAKEAVLKVFGTGLARGLSWREIDVDSGPSGAPLVGLTGRALEKAAELGLGKILLSISHTREYAVAHALGLGGDPRALAVCKSGRGR